MRKEWFEEVDGKPSRFSDLCTYVLRENGGMGNAADYAFRTLLAEDAAAGMVEEAYCEGYDDAVVCCNGEEYDWSNSASRARMEESQ
jgi:hypothetical protein